MGEVIEYINDVISLTGGNQGSIVEVDNSKNSPKIIIFGSDGSLTDENGNPIQEALPENDIPIKGESLMTVTTPINGDETNTKFNYELPIKDTLNDEPLPYNVDTEPEYEFLTNRNDKAKNNFISDYNENFESEKKTISLSNEPIDSPLINSLLAIGVNGKSINLQLVSIAESLKTQNAILHKHSELLNAIANKDTKIQADSLNFDMSGVKTKLGEIVEKLDKSSKYYDDKLNNSYNIEGTSITPAQAELNNNFYGAMSSKLQTSKVDYTDGNKTVELPPPIVTGAIKDYHESIALKSENSFSLTDDQIKNSFSPLENLKSRIEQQERENESNGTPQTLADMIKQQALKDGFKSQNGATYE